MKRARWMIAVAGLALVLVLANWDIAQKRAVIAAGQVVLLELRPVDPRSLMQGDYMRLGLAEAAMPSTTVIEDLPYRGAVILTLDENRVGRFARVDDGSPLNDGELRVQYRRHEEWGLGRLDYGAQSFFFQEGDADRYARARYAMRVCRATSTAMRFATRASRRAVTR